MRTRKRILALVFAGALGLGIGYAGCLAMADPDVLRRGAWRHALGHR